ncbi:MAG TPA: 1-(5-phosphoribosyl)-5-[(5-phosphoribosylamino)methylideneamino]imidazole-4-carboxamide isomerase [Nitrospirae bacterium]|nr:1-(5-phosphoribosyl)-5-[(5-phosphoribosylamino)methylideneamino]imidazole-4-carboxamide isomerase [Nitrospirota bacterium]HDY70120.1 1-(5-phosphoribosyl)-5-[(5-phosphoribosylamino)methylideneamino]imidazole-4-carboxamide isomerase [Nitrospirota bacterium]
MIVIPAIDLKNGECVRLLQGRREDVTSYSKDPVSVAKRWMDEGAALIHIVDLDGAFSGSQRNSESIKKIRNSVDVQLEVGGGIRDIGRIKELISLGIDRVILGTSAIENPDLLKAAADLYPGRILVGIDARGGKVAVRGWEELTETDAVDFACKVEETGAAGIIYTDILRDGMLTGPNLAATEEMVKSVSIPVIASGGVSSVEDIMKLSRIKGLWGAITGKALYTGRVVLKDVISTLGTSTS